MSLRPPTREDLRELADSQHLNLAEDELDAMCLVARGLVQSLVAIDTAPAARSPYPERRVGERPDEKADPFNAIVRRCRVKGAASGRLAGKRIGVKDTVSVAGVPLTCGSKIFGPAGFVPDCDATIVQRMLEEGAEIVAMLNMDELALAPSGATSAHGPVRNPHDPTRLAGGSSGGSAAALFYDDIDMTIGGDQGGSIRIPASWCGVLGLKPTHGLVPYTGVFGADATIDHVGPMGRSATDVALLLEVLAGKDPDDPRQYEVRVASYGAELERGVARLRVGLLKEGFDVPELEPEVAEQTRRAIQQLGTLGAEIVDVSVPAHREGSALLAPILCEGFDALLSANGLAYHQRTRHDARLAEALAKGRWNARVSSPSTPRWCCSSGAI